LEGVNFLLSYDPFSFLHLFSELEIDQIAESEAGREGVRSGAGVEVNPGGWLGADTRLDPQEVLALERR